MAQGALLSHLRGPARLGRHGMQTMQLRSLARLLAILVLAAPLGACGQEPTKTADTEEGPQYLFVQNAASVTLADGKLTMTGVTPSTVYFSDRPERITGHVDTAAFVSNWDVGPDSFKANPPNAALSILGVGAPEDIVVELKNPRLTDGNLVYDVEVLEGDAAAQGTSCALFIDVIGRPMTPVSVAGAHRRVRRRTVRRRR